MNKYFTSKASACFEIGDTDKNITVEGVEFDYPYGADRETYAISAVAMYIRNNIKNLSDNPMLRLVWVETSKAA